MTTVDFITALFYEVDEQMGAIPKHPEAHLWPSEVVTLGLLHALKGGGNRVFYHWLTRDYRVLFPRLPERTRLFRLCTTPCGQKTRSQLSSSGYPPERCPSLLLPYGCWSGLATGNPSAAAAVRRAASAATNTSSANCCGAIASRTARAHATCSAS